MPRPEFEQEIKRIRYKLSESYRSIYDPRNKLSGKEKADRNEAIEKSTRPLIYKMALLKRAVKENSNISMKEINAQADEWTKTDVLNYIAMRNDRYTTLSNFSGGNPSINNPNDIAVMNEKVSNLLSWMDEYKSNEKYLADFEKTEEAKTLKGKYLFNAKTRYLEKRRAEDEFKRLNEKLPKEKQLTGEKLEDGKEKFVGLWSINQAIKEVEYKKGLNPDKLFDLAQIGTKTKEEARIATERQKMMDDWNAAIDAQSAKIPGKKTVGLSRSYWYLMDFSGTPEANKSNEEIRNRLNSDDPKVSGAQRHELYKKAIDTILSLDDEMFSVKNDEEAAKVWKENFPKLWLAFESENLLVGMKNEVNVPDDIVEAVKHKSALFQQNLSQYADKFKSEANPDISKIEYVKEVGFETVFKALPDGYPHSIERSDVNVLLAASNANIKEKEFKNDVQEIPNPEKYNNIKVGDRLEIINPNLKGPEAENKEIELSDDDIEPLNMGEELKERSVSPEEMQKKAKEKGEELKREQEAKKKEAKQKKTVKRSLQPEAKQKTRTGFKRSLGLENKQNFPPKLKQNISLKFKPAEETVADINAKLYKDVKKEEAAEQKRYDDEKNFSDDMRKRVNVDENAEVKVYDKDKNEIKTQSELKAATKAGEVTVVTYEAGEVVGNHQTMTADKNGDYKLSKPVKVSEVRDLSTSVKGPDAEIKRLERVQRMINGTDGTFVLTNSQEFKNVQKGIEELITAHKIAGRDPNFKQVEELKRLDEKFGKLCQAYLDVKKPKLDTIKAQGKSDPRGQLRYNIIKSAMSLVSEKQIETYCNGYKEMMKYNSKKDDLANIIDSANKFLDKDPKNNPTPENMQESIDLAKQLNDTYKQLGNDTVSKSIMHKSLLSVTTLAMMNSANPNSPAKLTQAEMLEFEKNSVDAGKAAESMNKQPGLKEKHAEMQMQKKKEEPQKEKVVVQKNKSLE